MKIDQFAVQLYTLRDHLSTPGDVANTFKKIRGIGYQAVELAGLCAMPDRELLELLDGEGLTICSAHEPARQLLSEPERSVERLRKLGCPYAVYPYPDGIDFTDRAQVERLVGDLKRAVCVLRQAGQTLAYHNHGIELLRFGAHTILDHVYTQAEDLQAEIDTYWIQYGGGDPTEWCRRMNGRLPLLYMKDYRFTAENRPDFAEIGAGNLDWKNILTAAQASGCRWFIVEQDVCPGNPFVSIKQSFDYIAANLGSVHNTFEADGEQG